MRHFSYFLFENFDAEEKVDNPKNPRHFLNEDMDFALSYIADLPAGLCRYDSCANIFGTERLNLLIEGGVLRRQDGCILFDTPIILREDITQLQQKMDLTASKLTDALSVCLSDIRSICLGIQNGFSVEENLYHILCGMVFDGTFFNYLEQRNAVAVSRIHPSGLDYISVIYEKCSELDLYSNGLLCSYNRFTDGRCALQSFGDANGERYDFYRFLRLQETGYLPDAFLPAKELYEFCGADKEEVLHQVANLISGGNCSAPILALMEHFSYVKDGKICVPVFTAKDKSIISEITAVVEACIGHLFVTELMELSETLDISAIRHGVSTKEITNELYHILFGSINEEMVRRGFVMEPSHVPGEGRYLKSIQFM